MANRGRTAAGITGARLAFWAGRHTEELPRLLAEIAVGGESDSWRAWARAKAAELPAAR